MNYKILVKLLPIFVFYMVVFVVCVEKKLDHDQLRYAQHAKNLSQGFYAPGDSLFLYSGPGYPLLLTPFAVADVPLWLAKFLNPVLLWFAICFVYFTLREYMSPGMSLLGSYVLGMYGPFLVEMTKLLTEPLAIFLIAGFCFFVVKGFRTGRYRYILAAGLFGGYLILTKIFFAYVVTFALIVSILRLRWSISCRKMILIYGVSLFFCLPYLAYTYCLTGKFFYWANSGGLMLYWMTTPYAQEYGSYVDPRRVFDDERLHRHREIFKKISGLNYVEQDEFLKEKSFSNIRRYPGKYLFNMAANIGRMWYDYPFTYKYQRPHTLFYMVPNSFLLVSSVFCLYPLWKRRGNIPGELLSLIFFVLVFLLGSLIVSTDTRYFLPAVPILIIMIFFTTSNLLKIELASDNL